MNYPTALITRMMQAENKKQTAMHKLPQEHIVEI